MTADLTINTDFAQVEVDEQQVNLTRFPVVFPEKRDFFLEGRGTFEFARLSGQAGFSGQTAINNNAPQVFFTPPHRPQQRPRDPDHRRRPRHRHHGQDRARPDEHGDREESLTDLEDGCRVPSATCTPRTNFSVVRVRRDILRRSNVGVIFTNRSNSPSSPDANQAYGADASFSFFQNITANAYYARSESPELHGDEDSYQARAEYGGDRYGARLDYLDVGANFFPEIGFVQRRGFGRTFGSARFSPRMRRSRIVRRYLFEAAAEYVVNRNHRVESTSNTGHFLTEFQNSDQYVFDVNAAQELLVRPFTVVAAA